MSSKRFGRTTETCNIFYLNNIAWSARNVLTNWHVRTKTKEWPGFSVASPTQLWSLHYPLEEERKHEVRPHSFSTSLSQAYRTKLGFLLLSPEHCSTPFHKREMSLLLCLEIDTGEVVKLMWTGRIPGVLTWFHPDFPLNYLHFLHDWVIWQTHVPCKSTLSTSFSQFA